MKKIVSSVLALILAYTVVGISFAEEKRFTDAESGVSFVIPTGWQEVPNVDNNQAIKIQYSLTDSSALPNILFAVLDLYSAMNMSQKDVDRGHIDFAYLDDDLITAMLGPLEAKRKGTKKYGIYQYEVITTTMERTIAGLKFSFDCEMAITIVNGYVLLFQYFAMNNFEEYHNIFEHVIESVQISGIQPKAYASEQGVTFGMTPQEVQDIESQNNNKLKGTYESSDSYQLYYETDIHFHSLKCIRMEYDFDVINRLLFQIYYVSKGGVIDFDYFKNLITAQYGVPVNDANDSGDYSKLYNDLGSGDGHIEVAHWVIPDQNLGIDLWYNHSDTVFTSFYDTTNPASYGKLPQYYIDHETGICFSYMDGWDAFPFALDSVNMSFTLKGDPKSSVAYMQMDIWEDLVGDYFEQIGFKREDIGAYFLDDDMVALLMQSVIPQNLRTETYNGIRFRLFEHQTDADGKSSELFFCTVAMTVKDGYLHMFQLSSVSKHDQLMPDFEQLLGSVTFSK